MTFDFWLHAEGPGSHVLIRNPQRADLPGEDALREAASLAAQFSRARGATKVNVRWTQVRFVKKPRGAPPGQVILRRSQTVLDMMRFTLSGVSSFICRSRSPC